MWLTAPPRDGRNPICIEPARGSASHTGRYDGDNLLLAPMIPVGDIAVKLAITQPDRGRIAGG